MLWWIIYMSKYMVYEGNVPRIISAPQGVKIEEQLTNDK